MRAGVGERDRGAGEVLGGRACRCGPAGRCPRRRSRTAAKFIVSALLIGRNDQDRGSRPCRRRSIAMPRLTCSGVTIVGLPSTSAKWRVHLGVVAERLDDRVADQVGEADLAAARPAQVVVDHDPVVGHQLGRHGAHTRRGRHGERRVHVRHDARRGAAQRAGGGIGYDGGRGAWPGLWAWRGGGRPGFLRDFRDLSISTLIRPASIEPLQARPPWVPHRFRLGRGRPGGRAVVGPGCVRQADSRRRSRARPHRRSRDRAGTARTSLRRAIHWRRSCRPRPGSMGWLRTAPCSPRWPRRCRLLSRRLDYLLSRSASQITPASIAAPASCGRYHVVAGTVGVNNAAHLSSRCAGQVAGIDADRAGDDSRSKSAGRCIAVGASHGLAQAFQLDGRGPE